MKCAYHQARESKTQCNFCGRFLCDECAILVDNKPFCKTCIADGLTKKATPAHPYPQPYPYQYPYPYPQPYPYPYYYPPPAPQYYPSERKDTRGMPIVCGSMLIIVAILGLLSPLILFSLYLPSIPFISGRDISGPIWVALCFILPLIFSLIALLGGLSALKRKNFLVAMFGALFGIFTWGFYIGSIISFFALIMLIMSYDEFKKSEGESDESN